MYLKFSKKLNDSYNAGFKQGYSKGYNKALSDINMPLKEWDKVLWNNEEWNDIGEEHTAIYKEIMKQLPKEKRYLLFQLELIQAKQNNIPFKLIYDYITKTKEDNSNVISNK